jgi:hypothetical protein
VETSGRPWKEATLWKDDRSGESVCLYTAGGKDRSPSTYLHTGKVLEVFGHEIRQGGQPIGRLQPRRGGLVMILPPSVPDPLRAFLFAMECRRFL